MDLTKMTVIELKAVAYDLFVQLEVTQKNLQLVNQEIAKKSKEVKEEAPAEK